MSTQQSPSRALTSSFNRSNRWTPSRQAAFLRALAASRSVSEAARSVSMTRQSAYELRSRLKGEPFDLAWHAAMQCRFDALAEAALERAMHGVEVPHYYKGELIGTSRKFDERLTTALLAMRDRFRAARVPSSHPASLYADGDFGKLVERVEAGPESWTQQLREERAALYEEAYEEDSEDEYRDDYEGPEFESDQ